jgi:hypothetical protein
VSGHTPWPPSDIAHRHPAIRTLQAGTILHRFHSKPYDPIYFDFSSKGRLNAPDAAYGVLYAAQSRRGAFAETFLREPGRTLLARDLVDGKEYCAIKFMRALRLARLYGNGLAVLGGTAQITHGGLPYDLPQSWSKALHDHKINLDGIAYRSRHDDNEVCFAVFDRAQDALVVKSREPDLDQDWFYDLMNRYRIGLAPSA